MNKLTKMSSTLGTTYEIIILLMNADIIFKIIPLKYKITACIVLQMYVTHRLKRLTQRSYYLP